MRMKIMTAAVACGLAFTACGGAPGVKKYEAYDELLLDYAVLAINEFNFKFQGQGRIAQYDLQNFKTDRRRIRGDIERVVMSFPHKSHKDYYVYCVLELEKGYFTRIIRRAYCTLDIDNPKHPVYKPDDELSGECAMCKQEE